MFKRLSYALALLCIALLVFGNVSCSNKRVAAAEVTTTTDGASNDIETTRTTRVEVEADSDDDDDGGGGLFSILGDIIALPFKAISAIF